MPSAGHGTDLLPRLSGGPAAGAVQQADQTQAPRLDAGSGQGLQPVTNALSPKGPGYPLPLNTAPTLRGDVAAAVTPVSVLAQTAPTGTAVTGLTLSITPTLSSAAADPLLAIASAVQGDVNLASAVTSFAPPAGMQAVNPALVNAGTAFAPTAATVVPAGDVALAAPAFKALATAGAPAPTGDNGGPVAALNAVRPPGVTLLALAGTGDATRGIRADSYTDRSVFLPTTSARTEPQAIFGFETAPATLSEVDARLPAETALAWSAAVPVQGVAPAQPAEDVAALIPVEGLFTAGVMPGTPTVAADLSFLGYDDTGAPQEVAVTPKLHVFVLSSLFAIGWWGFGQFRDAPPAVRAPDRVRGLRQTEEETEA